MSIKYYTHFLLQERALKGMSDFRGVVEVNRTLLRGDLRRSRHGVAGEELRNATPRISRCSAMVPVALMRA